MVICDPLMSIAHVLAGKCYLEQSDVAVKACTEHLKKASK